MPDTLLSLWLLLAAGATAQPDPYQPPGPQEVVEVRSAGFQAARAAVAGFTVLDGSDIAADAPTHPSELFDRVPGAWIVRGSGQEHLTAIRSPVLTGPGACGAFLVQEDGVPIRPAGFCNANELFEVNLLQAQSVSVLRGPGSVAYGSNALHGVIDVRSGEPGNGDVQLGLEAGSHDYYRAHFAGLGSGLALRANLTRSESFRAHESYEHGFVNAVWGASAARTTGRSQLSLARLDQDTAGFILGKDAYRDEALRRQNLNPDAFREGDALRLTSRWSWPLAEHPFDLLPYLRSSDMEFMQHYLPGKPLERNGQHSAGLLFSIVPAPDWNLGLDAEWADGYLQEYQENPAQGSDFIEETRPVGFHYNYRVQAIMLAAWGQWKRQIHETIEVSAGLRGEMLRYDYTNRMLSGNTRDDGSECDLGGCLYFRPPDRRDRFSNLAPELGLTWASNPRWAVRARLARGFRVPQATELYRLQRGQAVAELETETLDTAELGALGVGMGGRVRWELTAFSMRKRHVIFRDANGFNVSDGRTAHRGLEATLDWRIGERWRLAANASHARHTYEFDRPASGIAAGNTVDTAPEWLGAARLRFQPGRSTWVEAEWAHQGRYFLDPDNAHRYPGHDLWHLRAETAWPGSAHRLSMRVTNLLDTRYAERADFAFGDYRYFPGAGRQLFLQWTWQR